MRFASLGSGSRGNSLIVDAGDTKLLLDCGFSARSMLARLSRLSILPEEIAAILVTHEHGDHVAGVFRFSGHFDIPVYMTHGTHAAALQAAGAPAEFPQCRLIDGHAKFSVGGMEVTPFPVPHDAREPIQFVISDGARRLGVLTDCGTITTHAAAMLSGCQALVLECNHDPDLLDASVYPATLKRRIKGDFGHLGNAQAAALLRRIDTRALRHIVAAHLSEQNNRPDLARTALALALDCAEDWIGVASQEDGIGWRES
ncbi:MAG: MBL fold metallo-hydrolase [Candidatus Accumulibacter sp.]|jgi:phosphoribosyl 1,2-cyclic phosphodiesterase|nr:MBL fold metallo-hydrolase [Accumulibacter sp.]